MALTDSEARAAFIAASPVMAESSPRTLQGLLATSRTLNNYGYRFYAQPNETDHNWGAFASPPGVPCGPPETYAVPLDDGKNLCVIAFPDDTEGVNVFINAMSADAGISKAVATGDLRALAVALMQAPQFGQQSTALYGDLNKLTTYLAMAVVKVSEAMGQAPDWYADGVRIDQALAQANQPGNTNTSTGIDTSTTQAPAESEGTSAGGLLVAGLAAGAIGYGLYKLAMRGPR